MLTHRARHSLQTTRARARVETDMRKLDSDRRRRAGRAVRAERRAARRRLQRRRRRERRSVPRSRRPRASSMSSCSTCGCPGSTAWRRSARLRQMKIDSQVVVISGHGNIESAVKAIKMGAFDFVEKPLSLEKTVLVIRNALRQRHLEAENRALRARVDRRQPDGGREPADAAAARAGGDGGADQRPRADLRRERHGQGTGRAHGPRDEPPPQSAVRRSQLRRDSRRADRKRAVRPRQGRVHRRGGRSARESSRRPTAGRSFSTRSAT